MEYAHKNKLGKQKLRGILGVQCKEFFFKRVKVYNYDSVSGKKWKQCKGQSVRSTETFQDGSWHAHIIFIFGSLVF